MSFALLKVPVGYSTDVALVVVPYVDVAFVKNLVANMQPRTLYLVVDQGTRQELLADILKAGEKFESTELRIRLGRANPLMHMKAFYFEFLRNHGQQRRKRQLLFGSANATHAAFSGTRNAELIAKVELQIDRDAEIAAYFQRILGTFDGADRASPVPSLDLECLFATRALTLHLPAFNSIGLGELPSDFDLWLQRGLLAAQYRNAPQFGILALRLKKPLPRGDVAEIFANRSFTEQGDREVVRYGYVNDSDSVAAAEPEHSRWKAQYSVWTHLGDWISLECYEAHRRIMRSNAAVLRGAKVAEILRHFHDLEWRKARIETLTNALRQVWEDLRRADIRPDIYLASQNGELNPAPYVAQFEQKLAQDFHLAGDKDFKHRYINGYEFPDVPRFRGDEGAWDGFVRSWCESVSVEALKGRTYSLVAQRLQKALEGHDKQLGQMKVAEIADFLRSHWDDPAPGSGRTLGEWMMTYHEVE